MTAPDLFYFSLRALSGHRLRTGLSLLGMAIGVAAVTALQRATHEENVRIALWRLDATLAELIALENTRPAGRFRSTAKAAGSAPGAGLGLALSRRLARRMGGDLRLASSEEGASFELWLRGAQ